jgi:hypothetical protein
MMKLAMSPAAAALFRELIARTKVTRDRILLSSWRSVDWQSLTFVGERHEIRLRITGSDSGTVAARLTDGIAEAEFDIAGQIVADIAATGEPARHEDGSTTLCLEALTIAAG